VGDWGGNFSSLYIFAIIFVKFLLNFYFYPPNPPKSPIIYFMIRNIYINIIKVSGMVRERAGGVSGGVVDFGGGRI
jgi:hypothetical protein